MFDWIKSWYYKNKLRAVLVIVFLIIITLGIIIIIAIIIILYKLIKRKKIDNIEKRDQKQLKEYFKSLTEDEDPLFKI